MSSPSVVHRTDGPSWPKAADAQHADWLGDSEFRAWALASAIDEPQLISLFPATRMGPSVSAFFKASPSAIAASRSGSGT